MGTTSSKSPNPYITDKNDPRYTELSKFNSNWSMAGMIGDSDALMSNGFRSISSVGNIVEDDVSAGDLVVLGNRRGVVKSVETGLNSEDATVVTAITVDEDLRYLPPGESASAQGYDADSSKVGRTVKYIFGVLKAGETAITTDKNSVLLGTGMLYTGTLLILKQHTSDKSTWTSIAQAVDEYHS